MRGKFILFTRLACCCIYCLIFEISIAVSQTPSPSTDLKKIVPPSPNASALGQYGNMPVGLYTGTSQFNIPIYEINEGQLKLPISLSYNSGGIKVSETASWVGLGFTLNAGGVITRTVYGTPDENGLYAGADSVPDNPSDQTLKDFMTLNSIDYQPDVFTFNFNGKTGKFFMNRTSFVPITPYQNLKIQVIEESGYVHDAPFNGILGLLSHWRITDEDGIVYEFSDYETNRARTVDPSVEDPYDPPPPGTPLASINAWYLSKIYSPTGDTIKFVYEDYNMEYDMPSSEQKYVLVNVPGQSGDKAGRIITNITHCKNTNKRLKEIIFSNGSLKFIANTKRADLSGDTLLNEIQVTRSDGSFVKGYQFNYKYSVAGSTSLHDTTLTAQIDNNAYANASNNTAPQRLMLVGVSELNSSRIQNGKNYSFDYELSIGLPDRFSKSRDLWGYYNGSQTDYEHVLQYQVIGDPWDPDGYLILGKDPDLTYAKQNTLKKITYPTGGTTSINYELNKAYIGKTVLPPESIPQSCTMSMVFENYNTLPYTDTLINGVKNYYKTFEVNIPTGAHLNILISGMLYQGPSHSMTFEFYDSANQLFLGWDDISESANQTINQTYQTVQYALTWLFPKGVYKVIFKPIASYIGNTNYHDTYGANPACVVNGWSNIIIHTDSLRLVRNIGGLRIKSTVDYDPISGKNFQKNYDYTVPGDTISSGELLNEVKYAFSSNEVSAEQTGQGPLQGVSFTLYNYIVLNNESNYPLSTTQGSYVGYSSVTVTESDPKTGLVNGKTEYYYTSPKNFPDYYAFRAGPKNPFPFPPADSRDWLRGRLLRKIDYQLVNGNFSAVKIEKNTYGLPAFVDTTAGLVPRFITRWISSPPSIYTTCPFPEQVTYERYGFTSGYSLLVDKEITEIQEGHPITTTQDFVYGSAPANMLPTKISTVNSQGDSIITKTKYSTDFQGLTAGNAATQGILQLQQKHILNIAVENSVYNKKSGAEALINSRFASYKPASPLQDTIFLTESAVPIPDFVPAYVSSGSVVKDARYKPRLSSNKYGVKGNLMEQSKFNDVKHAYLWDYQLIFPTAECVNADSASVAATSFEADGTGNWSITSAARDTGSVTGSRSYKLDSGTISKSGLTSAKNYFVTYWTKNASAYAIAGTVSGYPIMGKKIGLWTYFEHKITGQTSVNISGSGNIDELRLYPDNAQMTTYTYDPLVGMTSRCDLNNRVTYYEYDGLQRLKVIRDQDNNIIKTIDYKYREPVSGN